MHHRHKVDAPSGTALLLGQAAAQGRGSTLEELGRFDRISEHPHAREPGTIGFASLRGGSVAGEHVVILAAEGERIELGHRADSRMIFARGALAAAALPRRETGGALFDAGRDRGVSAKASFRILPPAGRSQSIADDRAEFLQSPISCWLRSCCPRRRPTPASTSPAGRCSRASRTPSKWLISGRKPCARRSRRSACSTPRRRM